MLEKWQESEIAGMGAVNIGKFIH
jgi:hypothetical protein